MAQLVALYGFCMANFGKIFPSVNAGKGLSSINIKPPDRCRREVAKMKKSLSGHGLKIFRHLAAALFLLSALMPACLAMAAVADLELESGGQSAPAENHSREESNPIGGFLPQAAEEGVQESRTADSAPADEASETVEQAVYPGVDNRVLETDGNGAPAIKLYYPAFGNSSVDSAIRDWVEARRKYFESLLPEKTEEKGEEADLAANSEMSGFYTLEHPVADVVSILFNIYAYTGGAHGNLWLDALNYNLKTGKQILFKDLFANADEAVRILSRISIEKLSKSLGEDADEEWLERGAGPEAENFTVLSLAPDGLFVEFQPYQVAPWSAGAQRVFVSLKELQQARPSPEVWNLQETDTASPEDSTEGETE